MKRYALALDLKNDPSVIEQYDYWHRHVWPEVKQSIVDSGIISMEIYRTINRLFMIMEVNDAFSFESKSKSDAANVKVQEWEQLMWNFSQPLPWAMEGEKWILMERVFELDAKRMLRIDAHQHFWKYNSVRDSWINESMSVLKNDFLPSDLQPILKQNRIDGCVVVQSDQTKEESAFQLQNAADYDFIKGVIGWVDFRANDIEDQLIHYKQFTKMKGFRHMLQSEAQRDYMLNSDFLHGISLLKKYDFTYDLLILPDQMNAANKFVSLFPDQPFVIDHLAKPFIRSREIDQWKKEISSLSVQQNVYCKLSGMTTEADWNNWQASDIIPYIDVVVESFGVNRILFGSDWPVCLLAGSYQKTLSLVEDYFSSYSENEQEKIFGGNAIQFYNL